MNVICLKKEAKQPCNLHYTPNTYATKFGFSSKHLPLIIVLTYKKVVVLPSCAFDLKCVDFDIGGGGEGESGLGLQVG